MRDSRTLLRRQRQLETRTHSHPDTLSHGRSRWILVTGGFGEFPDAPSPFTHCLNRCGPYYVATELTVKCKDSVSISTVWPLPALRLIVSSFWLSHDALFSVDRGESQGVRLLEGSPCSRGSRTQR